MSVSLLSGSDLCSHLPSVLAQLEVQLACGFLLLVVRQKEAIRTLEDPRSNPPNSTIAWANILLQNLFYTKFAPIHGNLIAGL